MRRGVCCRYNQSPVHKHLVVQVALSGKINESALKGITSESAEPLKVELLYESGALVLNQVLLREPRSI